MSNDKAAPITSFWGGLFQLSPYKRSQGRVARQITLGVLALVVCIAAWRLYAVWTGFPSGMQELLGPSTRYIVPTVLLLAGLLLSWRAVNYPKFADFLIAVEAEMNKVS
ncbi:MAG: preprotein translocase subunit SecE, partial [Planctomycetota bacterium]